MKDSLKESEKQYQYLGVGFIKSRKSDSRIMEMAEEMKILAEQKSLYLMDVIIDQSSGADIDRMAVDELEEWMERECIQAVVVKSVYDISRNEEDLMKFMRNAEQLGVSVYEVCRGINLLAASGSDNGR